MTPYMDMMKRNQIKSHRRANECSTSMVYLVRLVIVIVVIVVVKGMVGIYLVVKVVIGSIFVRIGKNVVVDELWSGCKRELGKAVLMVTLGCRLI